MKRLFVADLTILMTIAAAPAMASLTEIGVPAAQIKRESYG